jgi:ABC-2 type transport system ATP-binding protein
MTLAFVANGNHVEACQLYAPPSDDGDRPLSVDIREIVKSFPMRRTTGQLAVRPFARHRTTVIHGITLGIREGELFGILGLNGAGKTTLLKILATLIVPDGGTASVGGHDIREHSQSVREIASMVATDERSLNWRLSGVENLRVFAGLHRLRRREAFSRIRSALTVVGLSDAGAKFVGAYSSGMRQRLILARALLATPRVLLMDEPTRSLDPVTAHAFRGMLRNDIVERGGATVVLATHNAEEAFSYCDRVAVLHHGRLAALGTGAELAARFGQNLFRIWTPMASHPAFEQLARTSHLTNLIRRADTLEGTSVECVIPGDDACAGEVLRYLIDANVPVSRFERAPMPLSSLIGRIAASHDLRMKASHD